jgi:hypothetical protein
VQGKIIFGGEESAGITIKDHVPEKDGILACLLVTEMFRARKTLKDLLKRLFRGWDHPERPDQHPPYRSEPQVGGSGLASLNELGAPGKTEDDVDRTKYARR